ncbi:MarR family winged helix-turn-helix transcriptional regulator [Aerolutibacter daejeonensis]|uniref:MarR family winged helix-turn-helix transcriptional regulator n=1 Tax=Aerolutibacter daejeonensis TaxID=346181 RepID=UPI00068DE0E1|nr:MarR family transcriptional regulator [Lysobacter daejeonensis]
MNQDISCSGSTLGLLFRQVRDAMWAQMERELAAAGYDLTFSQYVTLKELANGPAGVTELARVAQLHPGAMTRLLDRLEERGIVQRVADPADRRAWRIHMTEAGQSLWTNVSHCGHRVREQAMRGMSDDDRERLTTLLTQVRDNLTPSGS